MAQFGLDPIPPGKLVLPPFALDDFWYEIFWYSLSVRHRSKFLEIASRNANISAARLEATIRRLQYEDSRSLIHHLVHCSIAQFERYLQVCSVDRSEPVRNRRGRKKVTKNPYYANELERHRKTKATTVKRFEKKSLVESTSKRLDSLDISSETTDSETTPSFETASKPMDPKFFELIHNLPPELFLQIQEEFFNSTFGPRAIHLNDGLLSTHVFQALNKELLAKYRRIFFSQNTWIIGEDDDDDAVARLDSIIQESQNGLQDARSHLLPAQRVFRPKPRNHV